MISFSSALTHSITVLVIAFLSHLAFNQNTIEEKIESLSIYLSFLSGGVIFFIGVWVIRKAMRGESLHENCCDHEHEHHNHHDHHHEHDHHQEPKMRNCRDQVFGLFVDWVRNGYHPLPNGNRGAS